MALRARIDADPRMQEARAKIDRLLGEATPTVLVKVDGVTTVRHTYQPRRRTEVN